MRETTLPMPVVAGLAATRGMLGAGVALLFGDRLPKAHRRTVGWTLLLTGVVTTFPLALRVMKGCRVVEGK